MKVYRGFTLIELLIVIAIIGLLASIVLASLSTARAKARDAQRVSTLAAVQVALELNFDANGTYFVDGAGWNSKSVGWISKEDGVTYVKSITHALFDAGYLSKPQALDPTQGLNGYMLYLCTSDWLAIQAPVGAVHYALFGTKELPTSADVANANSVCLGPSIISSYGKNYAVGG